MNKRKFNFDSIKDDSADLVAPPDTTAPSRPVIPTSLPQQHNFVAPNSKKTEPDMQISIKGPQSVIEQFKLISTSDRRPYWEMLKILMDNFEKNNH